MATGWNCPDGFDGFCQETIPMEFDDNAESFVDDNWEEIIAQERLETAILNGRIFNETQIYAGQF
jgi:hypothetical protein